MIKLFSLVSFKLFGDFVRFAIKAKYVWVLWFTVCLSGFVSFLNFEVTIALDVMFISLTLILVTILDRLYYKKITTYVMMSRIKKSLHMSIPERMPDHHDIDAILLELVKSLKMDSSKPVTYRMKTHQSILDLLLKEEIQEIVTVEFKLIGRGIVYEKVLLAPYAKIFERRLRCRFFLKLENKYEVKITI